MRSDDSAGHREQVALSQLAAQLQRESPDLARRLSPPTPPWAGWSQGPRWWGVLILGILLLCSGVTLAVGSAVIGGISALGWCALCRGMAEQHDRIGQSTRALLPRWMR